MATSGKQLSSLPSASSIAGNNEFLTWVGSGTAQKVSRDDFVKSLPTYRQPSTAYAVGDMKYHSALPTGWYLECTTAGTSASGELTISSPSIGGTMSDGTVTWTISRDLPISGGAMTGGYIYRDNDTGSLEISGGTKNNGGMICVYGENNSTADAASVVLRAKKTTPTLKAAILQVTGDGVLRFTPDVLSSNFYDLGGSAIVSKSLSTNGYIKYASGLIVQWGISYTTSSTYTQSFPINFTINCSLSLTPLVENNSTDYSIIVKSISTTGFSYKNTPAVNSIGFRWIAIGY